SLQPAGAGITKTCYFRGKLLFFLLAAVVCQSAIAQSVESIPLPSEAEKQEGVPTGKLEGPFNLSSNIFPGTKRQYWIYVPQQYDPAVAACSMIVQDGIGRAQEWRLPEIFDSLIHSKEMPVTIGIFVNPGVAPALKENAQPR